MILRRLLTITILLTSTIWSQAQQINAVPDYVFRNQMSVGRNAVTDTAAYFSIGPRYGATKGFMPPIVGDTATFSSGKRNGLLIFSVQKNKFLYWDSVRVQWSDMAGGSGSYILAGDTSAMLAPYLRKADTTAMLLPYVRHAGYGLTKSGQSLLVDTLNIATRAWRQKGLDSLAALEVSGSGTTNYVAKFTAGSTIGNSQIFDNGTSVGIGTASPSAKLQIGNGSGLQQGYISGGGYDLVLGASGGSFLGVASQGITTIFNTLATPLGIGTNGSQPLLLGTGNLERLRITSGGDVGIGTTSPALKLHVVGDIGTTTRVATDLINGWTGGSTPLTIQTGGAQNLILGTNATERLRIFANGRIGINTTTDAGYQLDVNGTLRTVNGANFATTSGSIGIGTASPSASSKVTISSATGYGIELDNTATGGLKWQIGSSADDFGAGGGKFLITYGNNSLVSPFTIVQSTSNIGISTTSPSYKLDINGTLRSVNGANFATTSGNVGIGTTTAGGKLTINSALGDHIQIQRSGQTDRAIVISASDQLVFGTWASPTQMALTSAGELLINTTTDAGDYKLQVSGNIYNTGSAVLAATSGNVGVGGTSPQAKLDVYGAFRVSSATFNIPPSGAGIEYSFRPGDSTGYVLTFSRDYNTYRNQRYFALTHRFSTSNSELDALFINASQETLINTTTDAGDYKLQVVGNARIGTGKLDIASNTTFGLGIARSGTSEVAGQIYNSNGILYLGAESSAGGQIFSGSSAYAGVIGTGANYPLQFATNNATRATINTNGELLINTTTDNGDFKLQVNGNALISGSIKTANGTSSTAVPWHLGSVVATNVQLDTANYVEVEINGVYYRLAIVTPL